jgi:hypothetical protein
LQLLPQDLYNVRDVHQLRFYAFMMTCFTAAVPSDQATMPPVVLRDWSFVKLDMKHAPRHLGFRLIGALVGHPQIDASFNGSDWFSTEIKGILCDSVLMSCNSTRYKLQGPAAAERHDAQSRLADIMQPFCQSMWPPNAGALLKQVSEYLSVEEQPFQLPQSTVELRERRMQFFGKCA